MARFYQKYQLQNLHYPSGLEMLGYQNLKTKITEKRLLAAQRGGDVRKKQRIALTKSIFERAYFDVDKISKRDLWLMAVMLYWAEGSKEKKDILVLELILPTQIQKC